MSSTAWSGSLPSIGGQSAGGIAALLCARIRRLLLPLFAALPSCAELLCVVAVTGIADPATSLLRASLPLFAMLDAVNRISPVQGVLVGTVKQVVYA